MNITIKEERPVRNLKDLQQIKNGLVSKAEKKMIKIEKQVDRITTNINPHDVYDEILEQFNLQQSLLNMLPMFLKYKEYIVNAPLIGKIIKNAKKPKFIFISSLLGGFFTLFYIKKRRQV